jgi:hypothetical protein
VCLTAVLFPLIVLPFSPVYDGMRTDRSLPSEGGDGSGPAVAVAVAVVVAVAADDDEEEDEEDCCEASWRPGREWWGVVVVE